MDSLEKFLLSPPALRTIAILIGLLSLIGSAWALNSTASFEKFLQGLPRNQTWSRALRLINVIWSTPLTANFLRSMEVPDQFLWMVYFIAAPVAFLYILRYVNNYLGARMVGWLMILAAKPILFACLVRNEPSKFVLVVLAYYWIITGMLMVAAPHFLRDIIAFYLEKPKLLRRMLQLKSAFGVLLIAMGLFIY
jgi:hypothetical protein